MKPAWPQHPAHVRRSEKQRLVHNKDWRFPADASMLVTACLLDSRLREPGWQTRPYANLFDRLTAGDHWAFRLTANRVHTVRRKEGEPRNSPPIYTRTSDGLAARRRHQNASASALRRSQP
mgnify:CR=1 FL=1